MGTLAEEPASNSKDESKCYSSTPIDGFRGAKWGMSSAEVIKATGAVRRDGEVIIPSTEVAGFGASVFFEFVDDRLAMAGVIIDDPEYVNANGYLEDYDRIWRLLQKKYGDPCVDNTKWSNDRYKDDPSSHGKAVSYGYLSKVARWKSAGGGVAAISISGERYKIRVSLSYGNMDLAKKWAAQRDAKKMSDL